MCRQIAELAAKNPDSGRTDMPNLLFTVAPTEWKFKLHRVMQQWRKQSKTLYDGQAVMTLQLYNSIQALIEDLILEKGPSLRTPS